LWGVIAETEAYCQSEPACHGHRRRSPSNETLFGEPGRFYVYVSYGIHHCVKRARLSKTPGWALSFSCSNGSPSQLPSHRPK
jgi:DNA-3-methyladenine glycosylase